MCTVTYIPQKNGFILTSSRDERRYRATCAATIYQHSGVNLAYPKDKEAGGTWIAVSENKQVACLPNGAFENHERKTSYSKSRGQVLIHSFFYEHACQFYCDVDLAAVEPFTLLLIRDNKFHEIRWDGRQKHFKEVDTSIPTIWSSATLYDESARRRREKWFQQWLKRHSCEADFDIDRFHSSMHGNDCEKEVLMRRPSGLQTVSISRVSVEDEKSTLSYFDLQSGEKACISVDREPKSATGPEDVKKN